MIMQKLYVSIITTIIFNSINIFSYIRVIEYNYFHKDYVSLTLIVRSLHYIYIIGIIIIFT